MCNHRRRASEPSGRASGKLTGRRSPQPVPGLAALRINRHWTRSSTAASAGLGTAPSISNAAPTSSASRWISRSRGSRASSRAGRSACATACNLSPACSAMWAAASRSIPRSGPVSSSTGGTLPTLVTPASEAAAHSAAARAAASAWLAGSLPCGGTWRTQPDNRSSGPPMPARWCRIASEARSRPVAIPVALSSSTNCHRRSGASGVSADQCGSGNSARASPKLGQQRPASPWPCTTVAHITVSSRAQGGDGAVQIRRRGQQQRLCLEPRQAEQARDMAKRGDRLTWVWGLTWVWRRHLRAFKPSAQHREVHRQRPLVSVQQTNRGKRRVHSGAFCEARNPGGVAP